MKIAFDIPDVDDSAVRVGRFLQKVFRAEGPASYQDNAFLENLVRLAQHTATEYRLGKEATLRFRTERSVIHMSAVLRAATHYETCITNLHRAICYVERIRENPEILRKSRGRLPIALRIYDDEFRRGVADFRNAIQHQDSRVLDQQIDQGQAFLPVAGGDEVPVDDNTLLTIDRVDLGRHSIKFADLAQAIRELRLVAEGLIEGEYGVAI